jgi:2-polyprenyl-3-methyl-5-hydroxy-6-metoxy-1,4-benzoquinol methylase
VEQTEQEFIARIDRWLEPMRWRPDYAGWREKRINQERHQEQRLDLAERFGGGVAGRSVLDLGPGMGGTSVALALAGAEVVASEFNRDYCAITRLRALRNGVAFPVLNGAGEALPLGDQRFDLVICWDVIEHVQDPRALLREIRRVLRPRGRVLLTVINRWAWRDPHYHVRGINWLPRRLAEWLLRRRTQTKQQGGWQDRQRLSEMHYFTMEGFRRMAREAGLQVADVEALEVRRGRRRAGGAKGRLRDLAYRLGLGTPAYYLYRDLVKGTYELVLWPAEDGHDNI